MNMEISLQPANQPGAALRCSFQHALSSVTAKLIFKGVFTGNQEQSGHLNPPPQPHCRALQGSGTVEVSVTWLERKVWDHGASFLHSGSWAGRGCWGLGNRVAAGNPQCHGSVLVWSCDQPIPVTTWFQPGSYLWGSHPSLWLPTRISRERNAAFLGGS